MFFFKIYAENEIRGLAPDLSLFFEKVLYEVKANGLQLSFNTFRYSTTRHTIKTKCLKLQTIDSEICSILIFQKMVWEQFLHHILCMIFQGKCFSCYVLLSDEMSIPDLLYFLRYWLIYVLQLFVNQVVTSSILNQSYLSNQAAFLHST